MTHVLDRFSLFNLFTLTVTFVVGAVPEWRNLSAVPLLHFYLGLFAVLSSLALHCLVFIYFLGTGRWVKEVALAYALPDAPLPKLTRDLKRRTFPVALTAMLVPIATAAAGMGAMRQEWPWGIHLGLGLATLAVNGWAFVVEHRNVHVNGGIIEEVMREVDRIRAERGLPSNAEALKQEEA
jgi:hypothetical protein